MILRWHWLKDFFLSRIALGSLIDHLICFTAFVDILRAAAQMKMLHVCFSKFAEETPEWGEMESEWGTWMTQSVSGLGWSGSVELSCEGHKAGHS